MPEQSATGHCLCGAVRFEVEAEPVSTNFCHCESCRRHTGGVAASFVTFPTDTVRWSGAEPMQYRSSPPVIRTFCGRCGSSLAYAHDNSPEEIDLYLGAFDDPGRFPPQMHIHCRERVAWFDTLDRAPRFEAGSTSARAPAAIEPDSPEKPPLPAGQIPPIARRRT